MRYLGLQPAPPLGDQKKSKVKYLNILSDPHTLCPLKTRGATKTAKTSREEERKK